MLILNTQRGFEIINFIDLYGENCSLQQSSRAEYEPPGSSAIWLGLRDKRMHLSLDQVKELIPLLTRWIETGSFRLSPKRE